MDCSLDIIIVNWNTGRQLYNCLTSISCADKEGFTLKRVVVVDNASTDSSLDGISKMDIPLKVIRNPKNRGFAAACNQGAEGSSADYLLFLNPDTMLFNNSLSVPLDCMNREENKGIGICGIALIDDSGKVVRSCARFPTAMHFIAKMLMLDRVVPIKYFNHKMVEWDHGSTRIVDQVIGAFFLVRRELFVQLGGFDEQFFVYFEEVDLSYRAFKLGFRSLYIADACAYHKGGGSSEKVKGVRLFYSIRSRILYGFKHLSFMSSVILLLSSLIIEPFSRLISAAVHLSMEEAKQVIYAYSMLFKEAPNIVKRAKLNRI